MDSTKTKIVKCSRQCRRGPILEPAETGVRDVRSRRGETVSECVRQRCTAVTIDGSDIVLCVE